MLHRYLEVLAYERHINIEDLGKDFPENESATYDVPHYIANNLAIHPNARNTFMYDTDDMTRLMKVIGRKSNELIYKFVQEWNANVRKHFSFIYVRADNQTYKFGLNYTCWNEKESDKDIDQKYWTIDMRNGDETSASDLSELGYKPACKFKAADELKLINKEEYDKGKE